MLRTPICDLLGIEKPVFQGGMAWIADASLAAEIRVVEPDRVVVRDLYGQISDSGAISGIAEARNEAIDGNVGLMRWYARSNECRLDCGVVPHSDCRAIFCQ